MVSQLTKVQRPLAFFLWLTTLLRMDAALASRYTARQDDVAALGAEVTAF